MVGLGVGWLLLDGATCVVACDMGWTVGVAAVVGGGGFGVVLGGEF